MIDIEVNSKRWLDLRNLPNERWEDIIGYERLYQISDYGRVKSLERYVCKGHHYLEKILKQTKDKDGYYSVSLSKNSKSKQYRVHQLVGKYFVNNPENKPIFNHLKRVTKDYCNNHYTNLVPSTYSENILYAYKMGTKRAIANMQGLYGKNNPCSKKVNQYDLNGVYIKTWDSIADIERELGYSHGNITSCCKRRYNKAYNFIWRYKEDINGMEI